MMKARLAIATFVSVLLAACFIPTTNQADGSACSKDDECKSHRCHDGFCGGSSCKLNDASSCDDGWKCTHNAPDPITGFFGNDGSETCQATCGHCPGNAHCPKDAPPGALCSFGKEPLELAVAVENAIAGRPVKLTASAKNGSGRLVECNWELGDGKPSEKTTGPLLVRTIKDAREHWVRVSCSDDEGAFGFVEHSFTVECTPSGETCAEGACCADASMRCVSGTCRLPSPPVFEIEGPTDIAVGTPAMYTAKMISGDGKIENATWTFADDAPFTQTGITVEHAFDTKGDLSVTVKAGTDLLTQGEKVIVVHVHE
jgi:hypothetical protein